MTTDRDIAVRFARETANHTMTVLRDDGLYRHLKFANEQYGALYRFDLITWPNGLLIRGDGPNFVFSVHPTADLFDLFKRSANDGGINPGYWQEKVVAGQVKSWSEDKFRTWLVQEAAKDEARYPGLLDAVGAQILHSEDHSTEYRGTAEYAVACFSHRDYRLRLPDRWDESFEDYSWEFLWACHAIVSGIAQYDAARDEPANAEFYQRACTYTGEYGWKFRADTITGHPDGNDRVALGWRYWEGRWEPYAYDEDDWAIHQAAGHTDAASTEGAAR